MLNMGGPETLNDVGGFLYNIFTDRDIIQMPFQSFLGPLLAKRRTPHVQKLYEEIGGSSPITAYTRKQGEKMIQLLDQISPTTAPHKFYVGFRYSGPSVASALEKMKEDKITRAIAFSQYPQFSCTTSGSSLNQLWKLLKEKNMEDAFQWSVIDRWPTHPKFIYAVRSMILRGLEKFTNTNRDDVIILFSAHSLPLKTVFKGDQYAAEVAATVYAVMRELNFSNKYMLVWQSQVGRIPWLGPKTGDIIESLGKDNKSILVVPIAFTSDHIETLSEIDKEFYDVAVKSGVKEFHRSPSLNDDDLTIDALASVVKDHIDNNRLHSLQYKFRCPGCTKPFCRSILNPAPDCSISAITGV